MGNSDEIRWVAWLQSNPVDLVWAQLLQVISGLNRNISLDQNSELKLIQTDVVINRVTVVEHL